MLDDAVAAFLEGVGEREFDEPLLALIRARGYEDAHIVHGAREFGKDIVAKLDGDQWAWQSKAGDVNQTVWRNIVGQLDELRLVDLGHGSFDVDLPRRSVLVTTGRLTGNAPELFRDYNTRARRRGEPELELWDRDTLLGDLVANPDSALRGSIDGQVMTALGSVESEQTTVRTLEVFSQRWMAWEERRLLGLGILEASLICEGLRRVGRVDLASHLALCLVRGTRAASGGVRTRATASAARLFETYAGLLWDECDDRLLTEHGLVGYSGISGWVSYPSRCLRTAEILGLLSLKRKIDGDATWSVIADWLVKFVSAQPGAAHIIGDEYSVSLVPSALTVALRDRDAAEQLLKSATVWICDRYEKGRLGLAGVDAEASELVARLLGDPFEHIDFGRRRDSRAATVILDLCAALGFDALYADARNDFAAVKVYPSMLKVASGSSRWARDGIENRLVPSVPFEETLEVGRDASPHHADFSSQHPHESSDCWDLLAVSSALRERHFFHAAAHFGGDGLA